MAEALAVVNYEDYAMSKEVLKRQVDLIQDVMKNVMKKDEHYGVIPGCEKPSLLKPGAEKLSLTFRLSPTYVIKQNELPNLHREFNVVCTLTHIPTGKVFGEGVGSCSTMETKFRFRTKQRICPQCGKEAIIKGKKEYGGGWVCFKKKDGCGAKFNESDETITNQDVGRVEYENPADYYNTVLKMAKKRAHVDAVLTATAASDIFTQDMEDHQQPEGHAPGPVYDDIPIYPMPQEAEGPKQPELPPPKVHTPGKPSESSMTEQQKRLIFAKMKEKGASKEYVEAAMQKKMEHWNKYPDVNNALEIIEQFKGD